MGRSVLTNGDDQRVSYNVKPLQQQIGELTKLGTTDKTSLVNALNEVKSEKEDSSLIGDLTELNTSDKSNLVAAINDNVSQLADNTTRWKNTWIDLKSPFGTTITPAKGDGITDDSQSFIDAIAYAESLSATDSNQSNNRGQITIFIPNGQYLITQAESLIRSSFTTRTAGLNFKGAGKFISEIIFHPSQTGVSLANNNDAWLHINFQDIAFYCNDSTSNFMTSTSNTGAQNYTFERCLWSGSWNYGIQLLGTNNNSEMAWYSCNMNGSWNTYLYAPSSGSDQFLNYNFFACNFEVSKGNFIDLEKGGNINIWGGSFIHTTSTGGTFFKLGGSSHAYGVQRFLCIGARMEHRFTTSVLINCQWNDGVVSFINMDTSSQSLITGASTFQVAQFTSNNQKMPNIKFDNCSLMGQHQYTYGTSSWNFPHNIKYENCEMTNASKPSDFITYSGSSNGGGKPPIKFDNCRGLGNDKTVIWDTTFNFGGSSVATTQKKLISLRTPTGALPITSDATISVQLPLNSLITNIYLFSPKNAVTSSISGSFTIQTTEATPTVLGTVSFTNYSYGFNYINPQIFYCNSDTTRTLNLVCTGSNQANYSGYALIEYI